MSNGNGNLGCSNAECKWRGENGRCLLFAGISVLECMYRTVPVKAKDAAAKTNKTKKGK